MKNLLFISLILLAFASCSKEDINEPTIGLLPKYIIGEYNSNGKLVKDTTAIYYKGNKIDYALSGNEKTVFEYTSNTLTIKEFFPGEILPRFYSVFEYNNLGKLVKHANYEHTNSDFTSTTYEPEITYTYEYNSDGTVKMTGYYSLQKTSSRYNLLTYDLKGNIVKDRSYWLKDGVYVLSSETDYTYDSQSHYFRNALIPTAFSSNINNLTKVVSKHYTYDSNNVVISTNTDQTDYQIEYNAAGFPSTISNGSMIRRFVY